MGTTSNARSPVIPDLERKNNITEDALLFSESSGPAPLHNSNGERDEYYCRLSVAPSGGDLSVESCAYHGHFVAPSERPLFHLAADQKQLPLLCTNGGSPPWGFSGFSQLEWSLQTGRPYGTTVNQC